MKGRALIDVQIGCESAGQSRVSCVSQPGCGCRPYGVHLWTAGAGRGLWTAGGWRSAGPGQTGEDTWTDAAAADDDDDDDNEDGHKHDNVDDGDGGDVDDNDDDARHDQ